MMSSPLGFDNHTLLVVYDFMLSVRRNRLTSRKHLRTKMTLSLNLTDGKTGGNLELESK